MRGANFGSLIARVPSSPRNRTRGAFSRFILLFLFYFCSFSYKYPRRRAVSLSLSFSVIAHREKDTCWCVTFYIVPSLYVYLVFCTIHTPPVSLSRARCVSGQMTIFFVAGRGVFFLFSLCYLNVAFLSSILYSLAQSAFATRSLALRE